MKRADVAVAALLALGFIAVLWEASSFQYGTEFAPGPGFAPMWLAGLGLAMSVLIGVLAMRSRPVGKPEDEAKAGASGLDRRGLMRVGATLAGLVVMLPIVPHLGLILTVLLFLLYLTLAVQRLPVLVALGASTGTMLFIYLVFVRFLGVPMPSGPLGI